MSTGCESSIKLAKQAAPLTGSLLAACLLLNTPQVAQAQLSGMDNEGFQQIEQPLSLKVGVSAAGLGLIGFELWWFLFSKGKKSSEQLAVDAAGIQPDIAPLELEPVEVEATDLEAVELEATKPASVEIEESLDEASSEAAAPPTVFRNPRLQSDYKTLVDISITYGGMQMSHSLMMVQDPMQPKFSADQ